MPDYIEGKRPVIEALRTDVPLKKVLLADNAKRDPMVEDILRKARQRAQVGGRKRRRDARGGRRGAG